jgi:Zn-dependent M28 family amino/carboxypeptidase
MNPTVARPLSHSVLRILSATACVLALLLVLAAVLIRQPVPGSASFLSRERADPARLRRHVEFLTVEAAPRDSDHPESLDKAAAYLHDQFSRAGARVSEQPFTARGKTYRNVIASFGPDGGPLLIVGAHYDAFGDFGANPGADDNASGTAGLLELSRLLKGRSLDHGVVLAAYSTEEPPFFASPKMGSAVHARSVEASHVRGMICLEMIGYFQEEQPWPHWFLRLLYPDRGDFIAVAGRWSDRTLAREVKRAMRGAETVPVYSFTAPRSAGLDASDQLSYWDRGISAVMVTDTAFVRNAGYHTPADTAATLDYDRMAGVVDGVLNTVLHLSTSGR